MLMRPGNDRPLPANDLVFLSFFVTAHHTLWQIDRTFEIAQFGQSLETMLDDEPGTEPTPFLAAVPLLAELPARIQLDLLAETWKRHDARRTYRATLVDGCVVNAAGRKAAEYIGKDAEFVETLLGESPRQLDVRLDEWTCEQMKRVYPRWWSNFDPIGFHDIGDLEEEFSPRQVTQMMEAAERTQPSPHVERNLVGLLSKSEIRRSRHLLFPEE